MRYRLFAAAAMTLLLIGCGDISTAHENSTAGKENKVQSTFITSETTDTCTTIVSKTSKSHTKAETLSDSSITSVVNTERAASEEETVTKEEQVLYKTQHSSASKPLKKDTNDNTEPVKGSSVNEEKTVITEPLTEAEEQPETFFGILIDEDCSDFEDPPSHDLPCMLMDECRASGYGVDIQQADGSWAFYMFDDIGQELAWDLLRHTSRMDGLYVSVIGKWENNVIKVIDLNEA